MSPARAAGPGFAIGRRAKAVQFLAAAQEIMDLAEDAADIGDAYVTLCVHAGIAASDTICARRLGQYNTGENHNEAVGLLRPVRPDGKALDTDLEHLPPFKTKAGYTHRAVTAEDRKQAGRRARTLVNAARELPV